MHTIRSSYSTCLMAALTLMETSCGGEASVANASTHSGTTPAIALVGNPPDLRLYATAPPTESRAGGQSSLDVSIDMITEDGLADTLTVELPQNELGRSFAILQTGEARPGPICIGGSITVSLTEYPDAWPYASRTLPIAYFAGLVAVHASPDGY